MPSRSVTSSRGSSERGLFPGLPGAPQPRRCGVPLCSVLQVPASSFAIGFACPCARDGQARRQPAHPSRPLRLWSFLCAPCNSSNSAAVWSPEPFRPSAIDWNGQRSVVPRPSPSPTRLRPFHSLPPFRNLTLRVCSAQACRSKNVRTGHRRTKMGTVELDLSVTGWPIYRQDRPLKRLSGGKARWRRGGRYGTRGERQVGSKSPKLLCPLCPARKEIELPKRVEILGPERVGHCTACDIKQATCVHLRPG